MNSRMLSIAATFLAVLCAAGIDAGAALGQPPPGERPATPSRPGKPAGENRGKPHDDTLSQVRALLQPWQPFKEQWANGATVVFTATYSRTHLPCISPSPGVFVMPVGHAFTLTRLLKGDARFQDVVSDDFGQDEQRLPAFFIGSRTYLVFLKPGKDTREQMQKPDARFVRIRGDSDEVLAIVDLSQGKAEAEAMRVQATRSGSYQGIAFTPEKWAALRNANKIDLESQKQMVPFLRKVVLLKGATLGQVRAYLGKPDYETANSEGFSYDYHLNLGAEDRQGDVSGYLKAHFTPALALDEYTIQFARCEISKREKSITTVGWKTLSDHECKRNGLPLVRETFEAKR